MFEAAAARLAGLTGVLLGWRADEFWNATPAELGAVMAALMPEEAAASAGDLKRLMEMYPDGPCSSFQRKLESMNTALSG
ncbi:phage tail assembly chaperone [Allosphingosinicella flava]|uniref:Phage tail assembly chaperone n=1 Tax=Allosphingosinicella flava TaxID=2771430 RepID=A0A7T2GLJ1_9SPHN|nr:phage tail assembly chaperone [Sphingosinicella flava]QPQ56076.1 phage tail assembly chaperone [Sphingosinicella flava]